jgi:ubiquinone biosynthesis monooxygenase Coq6
MRTVGWRYDASAVVATVATEAHGTAWQRFLPSGPLALLPFRAGSGCSSVVWTTTPRHAAALVAAAPDAFAAEVDDALQGAGRYAGAEPGGLARAVAAAAGALAGEPAGEWLPPPRVGAAAGAAPAACFPLAFAHAASYAAPRLALAGDAAHAAHPLAGQGLNLGIADAVVLARTLAAAVAAGRDVGDALVLSEYARDAAAGNAPMLAALDGAQQSLRWFANKH